VGKNNTHEKRFKEYVDWDRVSAYQPLSEDFIEKAKEYVNWDKICECQPLSKRFIKKFGNSRHVNMQVCPSLLVAYKARAES